MEIMPTIDIPQLSMELSMSNVKRDLGVAMLSMSLDTAQAQGSALTDVMRSSMELSVNPEVGGNIDLSV